MRSSLKALRSLETIKIFCSNENNNTSLCSRSLMTLFFLFFLTLVLLKIIMFLGVKVRKRAKNGKKAACFFFSKNRRRDKTLINSQQSFHTKKKRKKLKSFFIMAPSSSSSNNASFTKIFEQIHHKDRGVCTTLCARFRFLFIFLSLDRGGPRESSSSTHFVDEITSLTDKLFFSLSLFINIIKITDAWRFPI